MSRLAGRGRRGLFRENLRQTKGQTRSARAAAADSGVRRPRGVWKADAIERFGEQLDAIGSKRRSSRVELVEWNLKATRRLGPFAVLFGPEPVFVGLGY